MGLQDKLHQHRQEKLDKEKEEGRVFLEKNKTADGVTELPGGIQYKIVQEGSGKKPSPSSNVKAHYAGRLLNGKEFDNSFKRGQPFTARLTQLIKGWQIVLPLMSEGSKWIIWLPSDLAYGDAGVSGIPGGAVLEFEIELLQVLS